MTKVPLVETIQVGMDNRVSIPKHFSDRLEWIKGAEVQAWLLLIEPGRYRLLSEEDVQSDPQLDPIRLLIIQEKQTTTTPASYAERSSDAAIVARLFPITIKLHTGSWRLPFAEEWRALAPPDSSPRSISFLFTPEGFLEIWYTDVLRRALTPPWQNLR